jgi:aminoglycoside phosphotransferase (APT) family kinase protein
MCKYRHAIYSNYASRALPASARYSAGIALPETLGRIHGVVLDAVNLADLASHSPYPQRPLKRWSGQWEQSKTRELPDLELLIADLGTTLAYWPEHDEAVLPEFRALLLPGYPGRAELIERYCLTTGRDVTDAELGFWHALALWKIAVICEGILRRAQQDPRNRAPSGVPVQQTVTDLVDLAHEIAARAGI